MTSAVIERAVPERSLEQRLDALAKANVIRTYRAGVKRDVKAGRKLVANIVEDPDPRLETMRIYELLIAQPKRGRVKVNRALSRVGISPSKTLGGLSPRQRRELAGYLR